MATSGTYTWTGSNGGNWNSVSNWTGAGGSATWADSGSGSNGLLFVLGPGSGSYAVNVTTVVSAGAVDITSSNVTLDITGTLRALANAVSSGAGGTFTLSGGTVDLGVAS